ncbi:MAG: PolC-type DNA polymerase III [Christensenellales bacterium]|jgi:DNA polymerase-3 subunit alpha (Gram-positive type)
MSELWRQLVANADPALSQRVRLARVQISKSTGSMVVGLHASGLLSRKEYKVLKGAFQGAFPAVGVDVAVQYPALREAVEKDIKMATGLLSELVAHESPASMPFLEWNASDWKLADGKLTVCVSSSEGAEFLKNRGVDRLLEELLLQLFGISAAAQIKITGEDDKKLQEIADARQRELDLFAEAAKKNVDAKPKCAKPTEAVYGRTIADAPIPMDELTEDIGRATVKGEVAGFAMRDAKNGQSKIATFAMTDHLGSVNCKVFLNGRRGQDDAQSVQKQADALSEALKDGSWIRARGNYRYDDYRHEMMLMVSDIMTAQKPVREDAYPRKRVELHLHTQMSAMDACASATELIQRAKDWGHSAIAITDHGVVQAFPEAFSAARKNGIKLIPGCEGYLIEDVPAIVRDAGELKLAETAFVVLDVETTGLNTTRDEIIEIGAVRIENGVEVAEFSQLINPGRSLPEKIVEITGITTAMLHGMPTADEIAPKFAAFIEGAVLTAHNASFDMAFIKRLLARAGVPFDYPVLDTLALARNLYPHSRNHKLGTLCKMLGIPLTNAHRAVHDARATAQMLLQSLETMGARRPIIRLSDINAAFATDKGAEAFHIVLLAKNQTGVTNLNRLVSEAHLQYFYRTPRMPRALIQKYREGLIIGSACESGELYRALVAGANDKKLESIAKFYDYLEIQPAENNEFLVRDGVLGSLDDVRALNARIVSLGDRLNIPVVATGDVHFLEPTDAIYRTILMASKGFDDADEQPPLYFKTTDEMIDEFSYLGCDVAERVVIDAPNRIAEMVEPCDFHIKHPEGKETFQPYWPEADEDLRRSVLARAHEIYGDPLPEIVQKRIDKEMGAIIGYGFATLYMIAVKLVAKSLEDGYIVGSRGSVGSSLVAYLSGITEVNSLEPHYVCPACKHSEFDVPAGCTCGLDLPPKPCPACGERMDKDGFNIPFEVFLGFKGNKVPDIDLNFSGEYQSIAHSYVKELFGTENVFRAGTIGTIAEKTAYGYVLKYAETKSRAYSSAEKERLARGITGVKRTTGQHPAGMVVLPVGREIYEFTAIQHPADDLSSDTITTHFDFNSMHDILVKVDILGHDDPTMLRRLQDITGIAPQDVPLDDPEVYASIISLFSSPAALGLDEETLGAPTGTLGIPEFGTRFVRGMLVDTKPSSMEELIRISGLSHGQDVWLGNTQDLVRRGVPLKDCFCTRDDIMNALIAKGVESEMAFRIMEDVRKGFGLKPEMEEAIRAVDAPDWYIESLKKIKYMFPKAHAVAYVTMALRIAYFKVYYPIAYYTCYLMRNADAFDGATMVTSDVDVLRSMIEEINALEKNERERKDNEVAVLEILIEMNLRGVRLKPVDLYQSRAGAFIIDDGKILPPIDSLPGIGLNAAEALVKAREGGAFISQEDMLRRKVAKSTVEQLKLSGCLGFLPETSQVTLFDFGAI